MADPELVRVMDYILNRCNEAAIEAVAAAVVRRRRDLAMFGSQQMPDAKEWASRLSSEVNIGATIEGLKDTVRSMAIRIIRQEAPELSDEQVEELTRAWVPSPKTDSPGAEGKSLPRDLLAAMVDQFVSFSLGRMPEDEDAGLRAEMGSWPERYWKAFPDVIRLIITDFLNGEMGEGEFNSKIGTALAM
ncbi:hypothetical protein LJC14_04965 [Treponema sp. OttesenSCG-928-L16]|nr:hypothetical protein [Treponema sp. OttesenSCG-928-L16]